MESQALKQCHLHMLISGQLPKKSTDEKHGLGQEPHQSREILNPVHGETVYHAGTISSTRAATMFCSLPRT